MSNTLFWKKTWIVFALVLSAIFLGAVSAQAVTILEDIAVTEEGEDGLIDLDEPMAISADGLGLVNPGTNSVIAAIAIPLIGGEQGDALRTVYTDLQYPIPELGNCESHRDCRDYCNTDGNRNACLSWATDNGLVSPDAADRIREKRRVEVPGVCTGVECKEACRQDENKDACLEIAERRSLKHKGWFQRAKAVRQGIGDKCKGNDECREFCSQDENTDECLDFANRHALMSTERIAKARKLKDNADELGVAPGRVRAFCSQEENKDRCLNFAEKHDLSSPAEIRKARALRDGIDGLCEGAECRRLCAQEENADRCIQHAEDKGVLDETQALRARSRAKDQLMERHQDLFDAEGRLRDDVQNLDCDAAEDREACFTTRRRVEVFKSHENRVMEAPEELKRKAGIIKVNIDPDTRLRRLDEGGVDRQDVNKQRRDGTVPVQRFDDEAGSPRDAASGLPTGRRQHQPLGDTEPGSPGVVDRPALDLPVPDNDSFRDEHGIRPPTIDRVPRPPGDGFRPNPAGDGEDDI